MNLSCFLKIFVIQIYYWICTYGTDCSLENGVCTFSDLLLTETKLYFNASAVNNNNVEEVRFVSSVMHTLTDEVCVAFPNLLNLYAERLSLKIVAPNALYECRNLSILSLSRNKLKILDVNLLKGCPNLQEFLFQSNALKAIDGKMFEHVPELFVLNIGDNYLTTINLKEFPQLPKLSIMYIFENDLTDLDEMEFLLKFPNLNDIYMHNNLFDCGRLEIILEAFRDERVVTVVWNEKYRPRNSDLPTINEIECVNMMEPNDKTFVLTIMNGGLLTLNILLFVYIGIFCHKIWLLKVNNNDDYYYGDYYYNETE